VKPCLVDWSATSFTRIPMCSSTYTSWILLFSTSFTRKWWQSQTNLEFIQKPSRALTATWLLDIPVPTCVALFYILHYTWINDI
jgi:hypothetical protein